MKFEFPEDKEFFEELLFHFGGLSQNLGLFDPRELSIKRAEFSKIRNKVFQSLKEVHGNVCQLRCHDECAGKAENVDHLIPLSSNKLNKELRYMKGVGGKKVASQSFGSNNKINFALACARCNSYKKHKFPSIEILERALGLNNK